MEIRKQSALEVREEPEPEERTATGFGVTEVGIEVFEDIDWNKQRAAATGSEVMGIRPCCEHILKEMKRSLSVRLRCLISSCELQGLKHHHLYCCTFESDPDDLPTVQEEVPTACIVIGLSHFVILVNISKAHLFFLD